ncbi:hypothetical protein WCN79_20935 [Xanthomonas axonopodis pv. vasculorum]|uniref:hypothetical protein n=1 Tax=Xanthomonas axonopodis TaxID=53413 RepID=UPI0028056F60|nr:hypothetical protein [Xanthomonas axonopodis]
MVGALYRGAIAANRLTLIAAAVAMAAVEAIDATQAARYGVRRHATRRVIGNHCGCCRHGLLRGIASGNRVRRCGADDGAVCSSRRAGCGASAWSVRWWRRSPVPCGSRLCDCTRRACMGKDLIAHATLPILSTLGSGDTHSLECSAGGQRGLVICMCCIPHA